MHELSLLENVREILKEHAVSQNFTKVTQVTLEIGKLSCVEPEALRFSFDVVMKGSLAENATLIITELEGLGLCLQCGQQSIMETLHNPCASCGRPDVKILQGMEMRVKDLVVL
jgi:hydrogenase nickel incorporation protein HypA/HybF